LQSSRAGIGCRSTASGPRSGDDAFPAHPNPVQQFLPLHFGRGSPFPGCHQFGFPNQATPVKQVHQSLNAGVQQRDPALEAFKTFVKVQDNSLQPTDVILRSRDSFQQVLVESQSLLLPRQFLFLRRTERFIGT